MDVAWYQRFGHGLRSAFGVVAGSSSTASAETSSIWPPQVSSSLMLIRSAWLSLPALDEFLDLGVRLGEAHDLDVGLDRRAELVLQLEEALDVAEHALERSP